MDDHKAGEGGGCMEEYYSDIYFTMFSVFCAQPCFSTELPG